MTNDTLPAGGNETQVPLFLTELKIGMTLAYVVIFVIALFGNSLGLYVVLKKSSPERRITNLFIANMAVADLLLTFTLMPFQVAYFYRGSKWFGGALGTITCKMFFYVIPVSIAATVLTMLVISIDRFYAVFFPLRGRLFRKPKILSAIIWVLSFILMIPYPFYSKVELNVRQNEYTCLQLSSKLDMDVIRLFQVFLFITLYALPLFIMVLLYFLICRKLWHRQIPGNESCSNRAAADNSKRKIVRLLVIIVAVFAICWFPTYVNHYFWFICPEHGHKLPIQVQFFFLWLAHANSAINPCLYIMFNDDFRRRMVSILSSCICFRCFSGKQKTYQSIFRLTQLSQCKTKKTTIIYI